MGFALYVCDDCGGVYCESDLGKHGSKIKCPNEYDEEEAERKRKLLEEYWNGSYVKMTYLSYFESFWNRVDKLLHKKYRGDENDKLEKIKYINSFMYGMGSDTRPKYDIDDLERTKVDVEKAPVMIRSGMFEHMRKQRDEKGFYNKLKIPDK